MNYEIEKENLNNTSKCVPKKYQSFDNYIARNSIAAAAVSAGICAPVSVAAGTQICATFVDLAKGGINTISQFIAEGTISINVSVLQTTVEYIIPLFM